MEEHNQQPEELLRLPDADTVGHRREDTEIAVCPVLEGDEIPVHGWTLVTLGKIHDPLELEEVGVGYAEIATQAGEEGTHRDYRPH